MKKIIFCVTFLLIAFSGKAQWLLSNNGLSANSQLSWKLFTLDNNTAIISYGGYMEYKIAITTNGGVNWQNISPPNNIECVIDLYAFSTQYIFIATGNGKIYKTTDGGNNWEVVYHNPAQTDFINYIKFFDVQNGVAIGDASQTDKPLAVLRTTDGGVNWVNINSAQLIGAVSGSIWHRISFPSSEVGYFRQSNYNSNNDRRLYKTTDGGSTWNLVSLDVTNLQLVKFYDTQIGICFSFQTPLTVFRTLDGGSTWESFQTSIVNPAMDVAFIKEDPSKLWMIGLKKLYFSADTGRTWNEQIITSEDILGRDLEFSDSTTGWLLADWGKIYRSTNAGHITSVENNIGNVFSFSLFQNYPNPFNPTTVISWQSPVSSHVLLKVYDILGSEVATLVNEEKAPGVYEVEFDASSVAGGLSSGVYFYRIEVGSFVQTKKLVILK